jgi:hypothetical protein
MTCCIDGVDVHGFPEDATERRCRLVIFFCFGFAGRVLVSESFSYQVSVNTARTAIRHRLCGKVLPSYLIAPLFMCGLGRG